MLKKIEQGAEAMDAGSWSAKVPHGCARPLGAALVAMLRSRLEGARAVELEVEGLGHVFDTSSPLWEPVAELVMALRGLPFEISAGVLAWVIIDKQGPGDLMASDMVLPGTVRRLGGDRALAWIPAGAHLRARLLIEQGRGLRLARSGPLPGSRPLPAALGCAGFELDALFGPVLEARFEAAPASSAKDYGEERLELFIRMDGSVGAREAVERAASDLASQLALWSGSSMGSRVPARAVETSVEADSRLALPLDALELSIRAANCLRSEGISSLGQLVKLSGRELLRAPNLGRKSLAEVEAALGQLGLGLAS